MTAERWRQIESLFAEAVECPEPERQAFLDRACGGDDELRCEVESLLACDAPDQRLVEIPTLTANGIGQDETEMAGRRIDAYRVVRLIGHGGMGAVYLGVRDDDQYRKHVAIKVLKRGMDTEFMMRRFRQERQILANLEHYFIARLIDGGATGDGLPYFVMEYVDGIPITKYCTGKGLSVPERLHLFRLVCEAVHYAHQHLVVHRDIKPGNILVTQEGIPKLVDFGIAKVLSPDLSSGATLTRNEPRLLTPDYASPEQIKGLPISTATDIYSLGALLYELLCGERPHKFTAGSITEIERVICEIDPEKPSSVAFRKPELSPAARKQSRRQIAGDLDTIVLTAMRKDPQRRYESAAELAEDVRRHMERLPIVAQSDSWRYRAGKFVRRNRVGVAAACVLIASLIGGIVATTIEARRAQQRFDLARQLANSILFEQYDQLERLPGSTAVQLSMVQTVVRYLDNLADDASGDRSLSLEIARAYARVAALEGHPFRSNLGRAVIALDHYRKALALFESLTENTETRPHAVQGAVSMHIEIASVLEVLGQRSTAMAHLRKAVDISSKSNSLLHPTTLSSLHARLGTLESDLGNIAAEVAHMTAAVDVCERWAKSEPGPESLTSLRDAYSQLAKSKAHAGDLYGARDTFRLSLQAAETLSRRPDVRVNHLWGLVGIHHVFGDLLGATDDPNLGQYDEALGQYRAAAALGESLTAKDPRDVNARRNLAGSYRRVGLLMLERDPDEALRIYRKAMAISTDLSASETRNIHYRSALADAQFGVAQALYRLGKSSEALHNLDTVLNLQKSIEAASPEQTWLQRTTSRGYMVRGHVLLHQGDTAQALASYQDGLASADRSISRASSSLPHTLDRADLLEAIAAYYARLAARSRQPKWKSDAYAHYRQSLAIWQDWKTRGAAVPYAERRINEAKAAIARLDRQ